MSAFGLLNAYATAHPDRYSYRREEYDYGMRMAAVIEIAAPSGKLYRNGIRWFSRNPPSFEEGMRLLALPNRRRLKKWLRK